MNFNTNISSIIGKALSDFKNIKELSLENWNLNVAMAKDIADGLMKAKQIEYLKLSNNSQLGDGIFSIIYNLAFSPRIQFLDLTNIPMGGSKAT